MANSQSLPHASPDQVKVGFDRQKQGESNGQEGAINRICRKSIWWGRTAAYVFGKRPGSLVRNRGPGQY